MLRSAFRIVVTTTIVAVTVGIGWIAFGEIGESKAAQVNESFSLVNHQPEEVGQALAGAGAFIDAEVNADIAQIRDLSVLLDAWSPKYQKSDIAYRKFDAAIIAAENRADAYFAAQRALTEEFHSPELTAQARAEDDAEFSQYEQWRNRAHAIRASVLQIMHSLHDMDATLQKLLLRADFSFDVRQLNEVPLNILELEQELSQFQTASDNIRKTIGSPFDAQDE